MPTDTLCDTNVNNSVRFCQLILCSPILRRNYVYSLRAPATYLPCLYNSACTVPRICGTCVTRDEPTKNYLALLVILRLGRPIVVRKVAYVRLLSGTQIFFLCSSRRVKLNRVCLPKKTKSALYS